jgi:hypothetical protein
VEHGAPFSKLLAQIGHLPFGFAEDNTFSLLASKVRDQSLDGFLRLVIVCKLDEVMLDGAGHLCGF